MATVETQREQTAPAEAAVFVARDGRRARRLRNAAVVAGVLAVLWVVGLAVGMLGFGSLPGVALVKGAEQRSQHQPSPLVAPIRAERKASQLLAADAASVRRTLARETAARRVVSVAATRRAVARKAAHRSPAMAPAAQAQAPVNPAERTRGWSRKGYTAPRGQIRKAAPPPPPATSRGRRVGRQTPPTTPAPTVAPGQLKKAAEPPPPPPPPPPSKKG